MVDMLNTIIAKSDQLNADDLIGKTLTIKVTKVTAGSAEQPVRFNYENDSNKPFYPCKSMRRVIVNCWGADASKYTGRSMTLYRDPKVKFGGMEVGGIRISHMSNIDEPKTMALTATKGSKKGYTVNPLIITQPKQEPVINLEAIKENLFFAATQGEEALKAAWTKLSPAEQKNAVVIRDEAKTMLPVENDPEA